jgi:hypothetical protein
MMEGCLKCPAPLPVCPRILSVLYACVEKAVLAQLLLCSALRCRMNDAASAERYCQALHWKDHRKILTLTIPEPSRQNFSWAKFQRGRECETGKKSIRL